MRLLALSNTCTLEFEVWFVTIRKLANRGSRADESDGETEATADDGAAADESSISNGESR